MKRLHVQIQPARSPGVDVDKMVRQFQLLAPAKVTRGEDGGPYVNVNFDPADVCALWLNVHDQILSNPELAACTIVCCEGQRSWDDYRLLHHFDPEQRLDDIR